MDSPSLAGSSKRNISSHEQHRRPLNGRVSTSEDAMAMGEQAITSEDIAIKRSAMLAERQSELDSILDTHDTMVREVFHLEKFVTLLGYDPKIAKTDNSFVFQEYKAGYDLLNHASASAGPSRTTRRAHTQRVHNLTQTTTSPSKLQDRGFKGNFEINGDRDVSISSRSQGKQKARNDSTVSFSTPTPTSTKKPNGRVKFSTRVDEPIKQHRAILLDPDQSGESMGPPTSTALSRKRSNPESISSPLPPSPRKKRKSFISTTEETAAQTTELFVARPRRSGRFEDGYALGDTSSSATPNGVTSQSRLARPSSSSAGDVNISRPPPEQIDVSLEKPFTKRIRVNLIVRRPPPAYSNPRQRPPPPKFGSSLSNFLTSYTALDDIDQQEGVLQQMAEKDAALLERVHSLRKAGRILLDSEMFRDTVSENGMTFKELKRDGDVWDQVVEAVIQRARRGQSRGRHVAGQVASRVHAYWEQHALREDKARAQEEKRLRTLAKATIKMVTSEWKKAVFHIREQERLRMEEEELRRGHEHLDAILNQSGQILETQQVELAKGDISRSRSSSVSGALRDWGSDMDEAEGTSSEGSEEVEESEADHPEDILSDMEESQKENIEEDSSEEEEDASTSAMALLGGPQFQIEDDSGEEGTSMPFSATQEAPESDPDDNTDDLMLQYPTDLEDSQSLDPLISPRVPASKASEFPSMIFDIHSPTRLSPSRMPPARDDYEMHDLDGAFAPPAPDPPSPASSIIDRSASASVLQEGAHIDSPRMEEPATLTAEGDATGASPGDALMSPPTSPAAEENDRYQKTIEPVMPIIDESSSQDVSGIEDTEEGNRIPHYLKPFAVAPVDWTPEGKIKPPLLLRGVLRPYQQSGMEWLASLHSNNLNGILADEMGLGKTIQTISLLAHLACDRGIWGPHLIIVPTSVLLNWEMEFKKFLPGFKILSYHGTTKRRKELRQGWYNKHHFNVCITSYTLASRDAHIFKRKAWYYMILDEAHMIKNFKSQRWNILLMFRSFRRLLLTGTPLQNNLTELWALLQFLMSGTNFANLKEFGEWFSNPLEKAIEMGTVLDDENMQRVTKLHTVLRPYLLRRLKRDVEKELPSKFEHLVLCPLSKRQRYLYDEFMARAHTRDALQSGVYQKIANILMQLRKVCNHPDLFEVRPIVTSFAMTRSAIADFEISELLVRRRLLHNQDEDSLNLDHMGLRFIDDQNVPLLTALETRRLDATLQLPFASDMLGEPPPKDTRTIQGYMAYREYQRRVQKIDRWTHNSYLNRFRCSHLPIYSRELLTAVQGLHRPILPLTEVDWKARYLDTVMPVHAIVKSYATRTQELSSTVDRFAFATPPVVALDLPRIALPNLEPQAAFQSREFDGILHQASVKLQIAFPDPSLLQYDCGKLQELSRLLRERKAGGHRILIFTQMTRILDILEIFLNFHGYLYLRLDGATKIEDRQYITERFNADPRIFCFISSSRSGGVGINLTGADTVVFYDSDFNPQMDRQCEDRAHRIGQIRDVHIYRFVSSHTVEEAMLLKANQKRSLDDLVIQKGEFDWRSLFEDEGALTKALGEFEDTEDAHAAAVAAREENVLEGADEVDFGGAEVSGMYTSKGTEEPKTEQLAPVDDEAYDAANEDYAADEEEGGAVADYMISFALFDHEFFKDWRL